MAGRGPVRAAAAAQWAVRPAVVQPLVAQQPVVQRPVVQRPVVQQPVARPLVVRQVAVPPAVVCLVAERPPVAAWPAGKWDAVVDRAAECAADVRG